MKFQTPCCYLSSNRAMDVYSLIREVCRRKGRCHILDLGSGAPGYFGSGSYGSFNHTAAARQDGLDVSLTAVDVIWPPTSLFFPGVSPYTADYDFPGVACALREQGVECVGQFMDLFVRESAQQGRKWDLVLSRDRDGLSPSYEVRLDFRVLLHPDAYFLWDHPYRHPPMDCSPDKWLSIRLINTIAFANAKCRAYTCFRAIVSVDRQYVVIQATEPDDEQLIHVVIQQS
jgi:hypothetical protein